MKIELFKLTSDPLTVVIEGKDAATVKDVLSQPGTGKLLDKAYEEDTLLQALEDTSTLIGNLGELRVNGAVATLDTDVKDSDIIMFVQRVDGGR